MNNNKNKKKKSNKKKVGKKVVKRKVNNFAAKVKNIIDNSQYELRPNAQGLKYLECLCNPFGKDRASFYDVSALRPDGIPKRLNLVLYYEGQVSGASSTEGWIVGGQPLITYTGAAGVTSLFRYTGGSCLDGTSTATATTSLGDPVAWEFWNALSGWSPGSQMRVTSCALQVTCISSINDSSGYLRASEYNHKTQTAAATWGGTYAPLTTGFITEESHPVTGPDSGLMTRAHIDNKHDGFTAPVTYNYSVENDGPYYPAVYYSISATTVLKVCYIQHVELTSMQYRIPWAIPNSSQVYDPELAEIERFSASLERVTSGNSFRSVLAKFVKSASHTYSAVKRFYEANKIWIDPLAGALMNL
jgi:hypothetical protein